MDTVFMKCGCASNAKYEDKDGSYKPSCAVHFCREITTSPNLNGRYATCTYGHHAKVPSSLELAFFQHKSDKECDDYYCGCFGWD